MTTPRISTLGSLAAAVAAQNSQSVAIPSSASPETAVSMSQSNEVKYRQWQAIQNNAPQGPLNLTQMMKDVTAEVCRRAVAKGDVVLTKDNSKLVVTEDGMRLDPTYGMVRVADDADFPLARVDELFLRFAEKLAPHFNAHFIQSENVAENEMKLITEAHLAKLQQRVLKQYENEALVTIWKQKLAPEFNLQEDPNLQTHEEIRAWLNNPENAEQLQQVTELELSGLFLKTLPPEIGRLTGLHTLYLQHNKLTSLPREIGSLTALQTLNLSYNQLTSLPPEIDRLTTLQELYLSNNHLTSFPPEIGSLTAMQTLDLRNNRLTSLPPEISGLTSLQKLYLNYNQLTSLPCEIISLTSLEMDHNLLTSLPPEISRLSALEWLRLEHNQLTSLPPEIASLTALKWLHLRNNLFTSLPREIGSLTALVVLSLFNNKLTTLPPEISDLTSLQTLHLNGNPLMFIFNMELKHITDLKPILAHYQKFMDYPTESSLGNLFKLIASNEDPVNILNTFDELDPALKQKIVELVGVAPMSAAASSSSATIDESFFTDIPRLGDAVRRATFAMFDHLSPDQKNSVYTKIWELAGSPETDSPTIWGENHAFDEMLRFVDALEAVRKG